MEELHPKRTFLDSDHAFIFRLLFRLRIHKTIDHLAFALTRVDMLFHPLARWVDGHGSCKVARSVCHHHIRYVHFELLWVAGLEDQSSPQTIPRGCRHCWRSPTHADGLTT